MLASCQVRRQPRSSSGGGSVDFPADKAYRRGGQMIDGGASFDNIIERERGLRRGGGGPPPPPKSPWGGGRAPAVFLPRAFVNPGRRPGAAGLCRPGPAGPP